VDEQPFDPPTIKSLALGSGEAFESSTQVFDAADPWRVRLIPHSTPCQQAAQPSRPPPPLETAFVLSIG
jgi:hypothetical protein